MKQIPIFAPCLPNMSKKEQVKENIGRAAMQCFTRFGLEKTTLDDIAGAVGLNKASLYYYYKNKEDIFLDTAMREGGQYIHRLQSQTLEKRGIEEKVLFYLRERVLYYMHVLNKNKVNTETLARMLPRFFELYDRLMQEETRFLKTLLLTGMKEGEIIKTNAAKLASSLINTSDALKHSVEQQALLKKQTTPDYTLCLDELKFMVQLIFNGLKNET
jgi:TetR/AcrR family transcriptional regulator, biofilm operon repressor